MSGLGGAFTVIGTTGMPRRSDMLMSQPIMYIPIRSSDVRHELTLAGALPHEQRRGHATAAMPVMWSPMPPRW